MTPKAKQEIETAEVIIGYETYVKLIRSIVKRDTEVITGRMGQEINRAKIALIKALENKRVAVISSGDPGIYGMAGLVLEVAEREKAKVEIEIVPGITAATAAAATLGAPLMGDFVVISLSDILIPWNLIEKRLRAAAEADFVIVLYNPQSHGRREPLSNAHKILLEHKNPSTPVGIVKRVGREKEETIVTTLKGMLDHEVDMVTTIIIGNSTTRIINQKIVTSRGYDFLGYLNEGQNSSFYLH
jgi:precorrin-3B C17-methyltransferase